MRVWGLVYSWVGVCQGCPLHQQTALVLLMCGVASEGAGGRGGGGQVGHQGVVAQLYVCSLICKLIGQIQQLSCFMTWYECKFVQETSMEAAVRIIIFRRQCNDKPIPECGPTTL